MVLRLHKDVVQYCGIDIHLWGSFDRLENLKKALVSVIYSDRRAGDISSSTSSYRIVTGGMFGVSTWRADEMGRGPRRTLNCNVL